jgi:hypothetical protein
MRGKYVHPIIKRPLCLSADGEQRFWLGVPSGWICTLPPVRGAGRCSRSEAARQSSGSNRHEGIPPLRSPHKCGALTLERASKPREITRTIQRTIVGEYDLLAHEIRLEVIDPP